MHIGCVYIHVYMLLFCANGTYRYSFINFAIWHSVIYNVVQMAITLSSLKVLTALGKLACKGHLHNQLYKHVFYNNANGNKVFNCAYICNPLYYSANDTYNVYVWRCIWHPFYDSVHCIYVLKGEYGTHLIIVQMALGSPMFKWHKVFKCANGTYLWKMCT